MRGTPFINENFKGLNTVDSPYTLLQGESRDLMNVVSSLRGAIKKRNGSTIFTETAAKKIESPNVELKTIVPVEVNSEAYLIASGGTNLYSINASGEVSIIGEGFTAGAKWCVIQAPESTEVASQGPVYMTNGIDAPQYWTGAAKNTKVKEWTGVISNPKIKDGVLPALAAGTIIQSATAKFLPSDIGKFVKISTSVSTVTPENKTAKVVKAARIKERPSPTEVVLEIEENAEWEKAYSAVEFEIERSYYEDPTSKKHVPNGKFMIFAGNRVWMAGMADDPSAVRFSETAVIGEGGEQADPSAWPKENLVRFDRSDGNPITGIGVVGPYLVLFKEYKTWVIHDLDTGANRKLADTIGCVSHRSIVETVQGTFFLTADQGVYLTEGSKLREMSYNIRPTILAINPTVRENAAGAYFNNHYYLSFASGVSTTNDRTIDFDVILKSWWLHDLAGNEWTVWNPIPGETNLYTIPAATKAGVVRAFVPGIYTDSGKNFTGNGQLGAWWISSWEPFAYYIFRHRIKAVELKKRVRSIFFNGSGEIIPLVYKNFASSGEQLAGVVGNTPQYEPSFPIDFSTNEQEWGNENEEQKWGGETYQGKQMIWGGGVETGAARIYALGTANQWAVGWGNNSAEPFEVDAYVFNISFRKS